MQPKVSIILAVYNGEKYLQPAIESLLAQTYSPIEILIIDDGSTDRTAEIIKSYEPRMRIFSQPNRGQPAAQNLGISMATGDYIAFQDADDLSLPDKITLLVDHLEKNPSTDMSFGSVEQFLCPEIPRDIRQKWNCPPGILPGYLATGGLFRKKCFAQAGLFNEKQRIGPFIEWYMRAQEKGLQAGLIPDLVLRRRIHGNNMTISHQRPKTEYLQIVKAALQRRAYASMAK